jgi:OOP family OmpA-OmpF porin
MFRLGYDLTKYFGLEVPFELGTADMKRNVTDSRGALKEGDQVNLMGYRIEGLLYLMPNSWFVPYIAVGLGDRNITIEGQESKDNFVADYGAGLRFFVSKDFFIRADFRHLIVFKTANGNPVNNLEYTLGLGWYLGSKPTPASAVVAEPAVSKLTKPAPVPAVEAPAPAPAAAPTVIEKEILEKGRTTINVMFEKNKSDILPNYHDELSRFADVMKSHPDLNVTIEGYTDNRGSIELNKALSQKRADNVREYIIGNFNIAHTRLKAVGYGPDRPVADNNTELGRQLNRRVEASVDYWIINKTD